MKLMPIMTKDDMKIYKIKIDANNYRCCYLTNQDIDKKLKLGFNSGKWIDGCINNIDFTFDNNSKNDIGDTHACFDISALLINEKSQKIFLKNDRINAQFIYISQDFIIFNNLLVLDVLNQDKTKYKYFEDIIMGIREYHFVDYDYPPLFQVIKPNGLVQQDYFVTEEFIKIVEENHLTGFLFEEVWDSDKE